MAIMFECTPNHRNFNFLFISLCNLLFFLSAFFWFHFGFFCFWFFFKCILLIRLLQFFYSIFSPLSTSSQYPISSSIAPLSLCPWVICISSLASPFSVLFLTSPCLFCTYHLCFLFLVPFPSVSLLPLPPGNRPCDLLFCDSVPVLVVWLIFFLGSVVNSCKFVVILLFMFLIFFMFLDKSL